MKTIILTCEAFGDRQRFLIDIDENTGDAQIVNEAGARCERDRSVDLVVLEDTDVMNQVVELARVQMTVEVVP